MDKNIDSNNKEEVNSKKKKTSSPIEEEKEMSMLERELTNDRYCSPSESLKESLEEIKLMKDEKIPKIPLKEWLEKLKSDKENGRL